MKTNCKLCGEMKEMYSLNLLKNAGMFHLQSCAVLSQIKKHYEKL